MILAPYESYGAMSGSPRPAWSRSAPRPDPFPYCTPERPCAICGRTSGCRWIAGTDNALCQGVHNLGYSITIGSWVGRLILTEETAGLLHRARQSH